MADSVSFGQFDNGLETPCARASASFCKDPTRDDDAVIFGGMGRQCFYADLWRFSVATMEWLSSEVDPSRAPAPRSGAAMCYVRTSDGERRVAVFGGRGDAGLFADLHSVDHGLRTWVRHAPRAADGRSGLPCARDDAMAVSGAPDEMGGWAMVLFGGTDTRHEPLADMWLYHTTKGTWTCVRQAGHIPEFGLAAASTAKVRRDTAAVFGGFDNRRFSNALRLLDLRTFFWRTVSVTESVPRPRTHAAVAMIGTSLYVHGGYCGSSAQCDLWRVELVDASEGALGIKGAVQGAWEEVALPPGHAVRRGAAAAIAGVAADGRPTFAAFGGFDGVDFLDSVFVARVGVSREPMVLHTQLAADADPLTDAVDALRRAVAFREAPDRDAIIRSPRADSNARSGSRGGGGGGGVSASPEWQRHAARTEGPSTAPAWPSSVGKTNGLADRNAQLESENAALRRELADLKRLVTDTVANTTGRGVRWDERVGPFV